MALAAKLAAVPTLMDLLSNPERISVLSKDVIAELRGQIAKLDTLLLSRLIAGEEALPVTDGDRLLTAAEAAQKLRATEDWLYRHANTLPFVVRLGKKHLRFSAAGMERYIRQTIGVLSCLTGVCLDSYSARVEKLSRKQKKPTPKQKRFKTTLYLPEDLWKATRIRAIEMDVDATDLVVKALQQYLKKGGR